MKRLFISLLLLVPVMTLPDVAQGMTVQKLISPKFPMIRETTMMITTIRERLPPETERF